MGRVNNVRLVTLVAGLALVAAVIYALRNSSASIGGQSNGSPGGLSIGGWFIDEALAA